MSDEITVISDQTPLSAAEKNAGMDAWRIARLAAEKAVASAARPTMFKAVTAPDSLEEIFRTRFSKLGLAKQQAATTRVLAEVETMSPARRTALGARATVDLRSAASVESQVHPAAVGDVRPAAAAPSAVQPTVAGAHTSLTLRLHRVTCVDETGGWLAEKVGGDEIDLGVSIIDVRGNVVSVPRFKVGNFAKDGVVKSFAPLHPLYRFDLTNAPGWPVSCTAILTLSERDMGNFPEFLNKLVEKLRSQVATALAGAAGSPGGPVGAALAAAIARGVQFALGKIMDYLRSWWGDDVFTPVTVAISISSPTALFPKPGNIWAKDSVDRTIKFVGHDGTYLLTYDWLRTGA